MLNITGRSADEVWLAASQSFLQSSSGASDVRSRAGATSELLHVGMSIEDPRQRWVPSRFPALNPAFAIAECFWILGGRDDAAFLTAWNSELPKFVGGDPHLHGAYGARLRRRFGIDQLEMAYQALRHNQSSRQVVLQIWSAKDDLPIDQGMPRSADIPCNICASLKVRDDKLHWLQIMRSNDLVRGLPYNFVQFTLLQEVIAGWLGLGLGEYTHMVDSLHIYETDLEDVKRAQPADSIANTDSLAIPKHKFDSILPVMISSIETCASHDVGAAGLRALIDNAVIPEGYRNLLLVVAAESARRRLPPEEVQTLIERCTNPALVMLSKRWNSRFAK
jgi:thymidylate synthase